MFAVIKTGGKQYRVAANDVLTIEKLEVDAGDTVEFTEVLVDRRRRRRIDRRSVRQRRFRQGRSVEHNRGKKVIAFKKRRRQNSKRTRGHRQHHTVCPHHGHRGCQVRSKRDSRCLKENTNGT